MKLFRENNGDGRFRVKLPWKINPDNMENNRAQAINRDIKLIKQLKRQNLYGQFEEQIQEMIDTGIIKRVNEDYPKRYLPLLAVIKPDKESTKVRVCLDAKSKYNGFSWNDGQYKGKVEMTDVWEIITRFRCGDVTLLGDIKKMFWQIRLSEEEEQYHGIIFNGDTLVFTRLSFGGKSSPNIADGCMIKIAEHGEEKYPQATNTLLDKRYVDDIADSNLDVIEILCGVTWLLN